MSRTGRVGENTWEVIYDRLETEAVRGSWLCTYWLLQVSEFIRYASSIAGLLPEGHAAMIQGAASTSGAWERRGRQQQIWRRKAVREAWEGRWAGAENIKKRWGWGEGELRPKDKQKKGRWKWQSGEKRDTKRRETVVLMRDFPFLMCPFPLPITQNWTSTINTCVELKHIFRQKGRET